jgi:integrase/recombinase XerD
MPAPLRLTGHDGDVVTDYLAAMQGAGRRTGRSTRMAARTAQGRISRAGGWDRMTAKQQIDLIAKARSFGSWLMVTGRLQAPASLVSQLNLHLGNAARLFRPAEHHWFASLAEDLRISDADVAAQWNVLAKITAITGVSPEQVRDLQFVAARAALLQAYRDRGMAASGRNLAAILHRLQLTLFHAGHLSGLGRPDRPDPVAVTGWAAAPPRFAATARRYLDQVKVSLRPNTVKHIEHDLRIFGLWLAATYPEVAGCADLDRPHIEAFKQHLLTRPTRRTGKPLNRVSIKNALINLHCFFDRIADWGYDDAPACPLIFIGDLPIIDKPLPRFLDDAAAAKLQRAARNDPDPLSRLIVELLARTGIRRGELLSLTVDAVVQIGSAYWLRIPVGKLHNDRYIPLHPQLKDLLDDWVTHHRPNMSRSNLLLLEHNRPITFHRVANTLDRLSSQAGIGHVTAHQLRHTLATQAINRGMSLDAIAALLGHYAGDRVKRFCSGGVGVEAGEQAGEDFLPAELAFRDSVGVLALQGWAELDGGLEEGARLTDRLEVAVEADGTGAEAVAEHPLVHFGAQFAHLCAFGVGGQLAGRVVEGLDLFGDGEVLVGDGAVRDPGIHHGHPHRSVPEEGSDRFEAHAPVDGLGGEGVAQAVRVDVTDPGCLGGFGDGPVNPVLPDPLAVLHEQKRGAQAVGPAGKPVVEEILELRVQRNVAVRAELAQWHVQPVRGADLDDGVDGEVQELALAQAGAGEEFHRQADERVGVGAGGLQQLGERAVVEETGQRGVADRQVTVEDQHTAGDIVAVPLGQPFEAGAEHAEVVGQAGFGQHATASRGAGGQVQLVCLDVGAAQVGDASDVGGLDGQEAGELAQHAFNADHGGGAKRQPHLGDIALQRRSEATRHGCPGGGPFGRAVPAGLPRRPGKDSQVEQGGLSSEEGGTERLDAVTVGPVPADRRGQRLLAVLDYRRRQLPRSHPGHRGHFGQRGPLQPGHDAVETQLG